MTDKNNSSNHKLSSNAKSQRTHHRSSKTMRNLSAQLTFEQAAEKVNKKFGGLYKAIANTPPSPSQA